MLSSQFNMLPRPANVLVAGDTCELIRRRETIDDLLATQLVPARLVAPPAGREHLSRIVDNFAIVDNPGTGAPPSRHPEAQGETP